MTNVFEDFLAWKIKYDADIQEQVNNLVSDSNQRIKVLEEEIKTLKSADGGAKLD